MERTLPWLSNVAQEREQLKATSERERAASEQLPALRARYDELQKSRIALESACIIEQDNERRLDDEKRDSNRRLRDVQKYMPIPALFGSFAIHHSEHATQVIVHLPLAHAPM